MLPTLPARAPYAEARPAAPAVAPAAAPMWRPAAASALLLLLVWAVFAPSVGFDFTNWDDDRYILKNPVLDDPSWSTVTSLFGRFVCVNYHPLTVLTYLGDHAIAGFEPWIYHLSNVVLHGLVAGAAYVLLARWLGNFPAAFIAALAFALHPLKVESVAWISERKGLLCALFYILAVLAYEHHLDDGRRRSYFAALGLFVLALLSKVVAVSLPGVLFLALVRERKATRERVLALAPLLALSLLFAWIGAQAQASGEAIKDLHGGTVASHLLSVVKGAGFYVEKLVCPWSLSPLYALEAGRSLFEPTVLLGLAALGATAWACVVSWRGDRRMLYFLGFAWAAWFPSSGIVPSANLVADRYMYLPSLPLVALVALALRPCAQLRWPRWAALAVVTAFAVLSIRQSRAWADSESLWAAAIAEDSRNSVAWIQLSHARLERGEYSAAADACRRAIELGQRSPEVLFHLADAYRGLGEGAKERECARSILQGAPDFVPAWLVEARHLRTDGRFDEARNILLGVLAGRPGDPGALAGLGELAAARGEWQEAIARYVESLTVDPLGREPLVGFAEALLASGERAKAEQALARALSLKGGPFVPDVARRVEALEHAGVGGGAMRPTRH